MVHCSYLVLGFPHDSVEVGAISFDLGQKYPHSDKSLLSESGGYRNLDDDHATKRVAAFVPLRDLVPPCAELQSG